MNALLKWNSPANIAQVADFISEAGTNYDVCPLVAGGIYTITMFIRSATEGTMIINPDESVYEVAYIYSGISTYYQMYTLVLFAQNSGMLKIAGDNIDFKSVSVEVGDYVITGMLEFSRAPIRPAQKLGFIQPQVLSAGGVQFGYDFLVQDDIFDLPLRLTGAELAAFVSFFIDGARGTANPFFYVDVLGAVVRVRFAEPILPQITEVAYDSYTVTVQLRVQ
jgi:hypothetical protein